MKRFYLILLSFIIVTGAFAQNAILNSPDKNLNDVSIDLKPVKKHFAQKNSTKTQQSRWYNHGFAIDDVMGNGVINANNLWPDSTVLVNYGTAYAGPWIHSISQILDPTSTWFNDFGTYNLYIYLLPILLIVSVSTSYTTAVIREPVLSTPLNLMYLLKMNRQIRFITM